MDDPLTSVIASLIDRRKKQHVSQIEMGHRLGCSRFSIIRFEKGECSYSLDFLHRYAQALNGKVHAFVVFDHQP